jgi:excisionase family DNA binding protein
MQELNKRAEEKFAIKGTWTKDAPEARRCLEEGIKILARMIAEAIMKEKSIVAKTSEEPDDDTEIISSASVAVGKQEKLTLTVTEASKLLGLSRASAYEAVRMGQIPSIRMGSRILIPKIALVEMLKEASNDKIGSRQQI